VAWQMVSGGFDCFPFRVLWSNYAGCVLSVQLLILFNELLGYCRMMLWEMADG
jgi:hypothetical protein